MFFKDLDDILKYIVALSNVSGGEIFIENYDLQDLEIAIKDKIINIPDYWFKNKENNYILNIKSNKIDTFLKLDTEFGYEFIRFIIKEDEIIPATKEMRETILISEKEVLVKCNSFISDTEVIDNREIKNKIINIKDNLILFVKRNLLYSKDKLWNISPEIVENAINKALYEYNYENNFPIELSIFDSNKIIIKYFLGNKKDRRFVDAIDVKDEYLFGNKIRVLILNADNDNIPKKTVFKEHKKESISFMESKENGIAYSSKTLKFKIMLEITKSPVTSKEIMSALELKDRESFYNTYLKPAIKEGYIKYTIPEKPRSPKQKYVRTEKGNEYLKSRF